VTGVQTCALPIFLDEASKVRRLPNPSSDRIPDEPSQVLDLLDPVPGVAQAQVAFRAHPPVACDLVARLEDVPGGAWRPARQERRAGLKKAMGKEFNRRN
jgi:hypothetical protein